MDKIFDTLYVPLPLNDYSRLWDLAWQRLTWSSIISFFSLKCFGGFQGSESICVFKNTF